MNDISAIIKAWSVTTFVAFGALWFEYYLFPTLILFFILWMLSSWLDLGLGYYVSYRKRIITSKIFNDWLMSKTSKRIWVGVLLIVIWHIISISKNDYIDVVIATLWFVWVMLSAWWEWISIVENTILIADKRDSIFLKFVARIMGIWYDHVIRKIERKVADVTWTQQQHQS